MAHSIPQPVEGRGDAERLPPGRGRRSSAANGHAERRRSVDVARAPELHAEVHQCEQAGKEELSLYGT